MRDGGLGALLAERRRRAGLSQAALAARLPGLLTRTALASLEQGLTRTISADLANALPGIIPVTVEELVEAMGYALTPPVGSLDRELLAELQCADSLEQEAVRALLLGYRSQRQGSARQAQL